MVFQIKFSDNTPIVNEFEENLRRQHIHDLSNENNLEENEDCNDYPAFI